MSDLLIRHGGQVSDLLTCELLAMSFEPITITDY